MTVGCGDNRTGTDARDTASDGWTERPNDRGGAGGGSPGSGGAGGSTAGSGGSAGTAGGGGSAGAGGSVGSNDGGGSDAPDAGGSDGGGTPTCTDGIKNSDETGIDCGGHCGKCAAGNPCLVDADCQFACRADKTCAACNVAADCPGIESECEHRTCTVGVCGSAREAAGTVLTVQTTGDCKRRQCAADGSVTPANDDTDVPEDRNPCTNDICTSGTASHTMMPANSNCGGANHCNDTGQCVGCAVAADCPGTDTACRTRTCSAGGVCGFSFTASGTKLVDPTAGDCKGLQCDGAGNSQVFSDNADLPVDGNLCTTDECSAGTPSHRPVASGTVCGGGVVCDGASHCVAVPVGAHLPRHRRGLPHAQLCLRCVRHRQHGDGHPHRRADGTRLQEDRLRRPGLDLIANDDLDLPVDGNAVHAGRVHRGDADAIRSSRPATAAAPARSATARAPVSPA